MAHLTTREAAALLGVHQNTVRTLADQGKLPHWRTAGGHRRFDEHALRKLDPRHLAGEQRAAEIRVAAWRKAALGVLHAARTDLGADSPHARIFEAAARQLK